jgi:hypothetical protein
MNSFKKKSDDETQGKHFNLFLILNVDDNAQAAELNSIVCGSVRTGKFRNSSSLNWGIQCRTSKWVCKMVLFSNDST